MRRKRCMGCHREEGAAVEAMYLCLNCRAAWMCDPRRQEILALPNILKELHQAAWCEDRRRSHGR